MRFFVRPLLVLVGVLLASFAVATYKRTRAFQVGYAGLGLEVIKSEQQLSETVAANRVPAPLPPIRGGQLAVDAYKNVEVLGHLSAGEFTRVMTAMTMWVSPDAGCAYCHAPSRDKDGNIVRDARGLAVADPNLMSSDELYTKVVARRMLQMTMRINGDWKDHVKETGVTCFTCHRAQPVPANVWYDVPREATRYQGIPNPPRYAPATLAGMAALPVGVLRPFLAGNEEIRVQRTEAMEDTRRPSIKQTEWTYGLMLHMSSALGVNCGYCHNSRVFRDWAHSPLTRTTAWHGIRMVRELNSQFLEPLKPTFPAHRLGPRGDPPKINCATCHQGSYKPLLGVSMLKDYPELASLKPQPPKTAAAAPPTTPPAADVPPAAGLTPQGTPQQAAPPQQRDTVPPQEATPSQPATIPEPATAPEE